MKLRRKGIKPESSGIDSFIKKCPACGDEDKKNRKTDHDHAEVYCDACGYVIADITENHHFQMIVNKTV